MADLHAAPADPLAEAIAALMRSDPDPFFVQVGGFDGVSFDPLRRQIAEKNLAGLIVEPIPQYFEKLRDLYAGNPKVLPVNCAITEEDGERVIWRFDPAAVEQGLLPPHFAGISSFLMEDLLKETGVLGRSSPNAQTTAALRALLQPVTVRCRTMSGLLADHGVAKVDILQIDTEGYDFIILKLFDFARYRPAIVHYEHQHLAPADRDAAEALLRSHGYTIQRERYDTLAVRGAASVLDRLGALRGLALALGTEGRGDDALLLLDHLATIYPSDGETQLALARALGARGRTLESLERMAAYRAVATDQERLVTEIRTQMEPAIHRFNGHLAAGEIAEAEKYAAALSGLAPRNPALLEAALSCNMALGRQDRIAEYAGMLLTLDPNHAAARAAIAAVKPPPMADDVTGRVERALALTEAHPLLRLRDLHDAASAVLCRRLTEDGVRQVARLQAAARTIALNAPAGSELEAWESHYRAMLDAIDLDAVTGATPPVDALDLELATATGNPLTWAGLKTAATRQRAAVVFLAAADQAYVDLYGRWFVRSILKNCDVPCLVIVQVIGGAGRLRETAKSLGTSDPRLILAGDRFDAAEATARCYDAPPKGLSAKPVAHLQSMRFMGLGTVLQRLGRPVFVSDIDLLLQRGVADLLESCSDFDLVFNENAGSPHAGSRLTANLLLANPTPAARDFQAFLQAYLQRALAGASVTRWIDQLALLMARHHLMLRAEAPRLGHFDTASDINNVMYRSYQENPFRFLSLYHGFDTASLSVLDDEPAGTAAAEPARRTRAPSTRRPRRTAAG